MATSSHTNAPRPRRSGGRALPGDGVLLVDDADDRRPDSRAASAPPPTADPTPPQDRKRERRRRAYLADDEEEAPPVRATGDGPRPVVYERLIDLDRVDGDALRALRRLREAGFVAYLVGGGVRDLLLGRNPKDFDLATDARPQDVRRVFRNCRIIGRRFRLAHIHFADGKILECATFRRDPEQVLGELPPDVAEERSHRAEGAVRLVPLRSVGADDDLLIRQDNHFGLPHEDAARRDFTINGLFLDASRNEVIDYVGGVADIERRVLRTIGEPSIRFREDPIRILRAIKFGARLDMGFSPSLYDAIVEHRGDLDRAAKPRLFEEMLRLLRGGAAHRSFYLAWDLGVLSVVMPELAAFLDDDEAGGQRTFARLAAVDARVQRGELPSDGVLFSALFADAMREALDGERDIVEAFDSQFAETHERIATPRKMKERMLALHVAGERIRRGKVSAAASMGAFEEARLLHVLDLEVEGQAPPEWALGDAPIPEDAEASGKKKKRRRRKKKTTAG